MSVSDEKRLLRVKYQQLRAAYSPQQRECFHQRIAADVCSLPAFRDQRTALLCYASTPDEVDTWRILRKAWQDGKTVALPRCEAGGVMTFYCVTDERELQSGMLGISEPSANCTPYIPKANDLCVVPGLAFDRSGCRLGYGGGYYDRYLSRFPMVTVGLCYPLCFADKLPTEPFDIPVQQVICCDDEKEA